MRQAPRSARGGRAEMAGTREMAEMIAVGLVLRAHGLRGEVLVLPDSDNPTRFQTGSELFVRDGARQRRLRVASSRSHRGRELVQFVDVRDRDAAEALRGALLEAPEETVPAAEEGTFYYFELVGCRVVDRALGDLGVVAEVVEDGGGVLLSVALSADPSDGSRRDGEDADEIERDDDNAGNSRRGRIAAPAEEAVGAGGGRGGSGGRGRTLLIPFANQLLPKILVEERLIHSDLPKGLLEACASTS